MTFLSLSAAPGVSRSIWDDPVPTLFRLLFVIGLIAALGYGAMIALVTFVQPQPREITQTVPLPKGVR
jgi:hypothetical protein